MTIPDDDVVAKAAKETGRLQRELDITNADHIALWLEANTVSDEPMNQCISWLACRIVEAHEAAIPERTASPDLVEVLREAVTRLCGELQKTVDHSCTCDECNRIRSVAASELEALQTTHDGGWRG